MEDDSNTNGIGTSDNEVINAGGKFCGVRIYDECNDGRIVGTFGTFPQQPHIPTDAGFSLLAAIAADGSIGDDDNAYLNEDHDGTLILCTSPVQDIFPFTVSCLVLNSLIQSRYNFAHSLLGSWYSIGAVGLGVALYAPWGFRDSYATTVPVVLNSFIQSRYNFAHSLLG
jgi:hypothetical protein